LRNAVVVIESALERAHLAEAEALLRQLPDPATPQALILNARLELLRDDAPAAIRLLSNQRFAEPRLQLRRELLLGRAFVKAGEYESADEHFDAAEELASRSGDPDARAELAYERGRRYAFARDLERAREQLAFAAQTESPTRKVEALQLQAFIEGLEGRYAQEAAALIRLLQQIDPSDQQFNWPAAFATFTLAVLARELFLPEALPIVDAVLRTCNWPAELNLPHFQALKALGWSYALRGDYFNGFRYLKKSMAHAPTPAWQAMAALDRAYLARCLNEERWSRQELNDAEELSERVDWRATRNEERVALLLFAELFAPIDAQRAQQYLAAFSDLTDLRVPNLHYGAHDERLRAQADYSAGVTELARGNDKTAVKRLQDSFAVYDRIGYEWRAGRAALRLYETTRDSRWLRVAGEKLHRYPDSWLAAELRAVARNASAEVTLPPMQQRVFEELCRGLSTAEIAKNLGRSQYTVKNHIKLIFKAYGVKSRAALIARVSGRSD
jgi:DNA-binding CsgD family transcriptional regulator